MADYVSKYTGSVIDEAIGKVVDGLTDAVSPTASVKQTADGATISITDKDGTTTATIRNGEDGKDGSAGAPGADGSDGVGVSNIYQKTTSVEDGGENVFVIELTDGTISNFKVRNGSKGSAGADGSPGVDGKDGADGAAGKDGTSVTIKSVSTSSADGGSNVVTFSDGKTLTVKNGSKGSTGAAGKDGVDGKTPVKGVDYFDGSPGEPGAPGADGHTPVKGVDYYTEADKAEFSQYIASELAKRGQLKPEFAQSEAWLNANGDTSKLYVLPDGMIWANVQTVTESEKVPNFTNLMDDPNAYIKDGYRYSSSSAAFKECPTDCAVVVPITASEAYTIRMIGASNNATQQYRNSIYFGTSNTSFTGTFDTSKLTYDIDANVDSSIYFSNPPSGSYSYMVFHVADGVDADNLIVTVNEEITYTPTEGGVEYRWASTGRAFVPADYEDRIVALEGGLAEAEGDIEALQTKVGGMAMTTNATTAFSIPAYCPVPQLPADGSEGADFDYKATTTQDAYDYMDALCGKYTQYITKQTMGQDASGAFDHNRYILSKAYWRAWQKENYPRMFAWINGSTVIYSVSVSPRVGDTMYSTPYIGTVYSTVTAVNSAAKTASTRTVNGLVFTRHESGDVEPTIAYTKPPQYPGSFAAASVYNSAFGSLTKVSTVGSDYFTGADGIKYIRYPFEDRGQDKTKPLSIFILSNEHGNYGDDLIPSFVVMRMAKDLCKNTENPFLKWLKENCMITMIPVGNPWGYARYLESGNTSGYYNSNGININRNYDTPGWSTSDTNYGETETFGAYPGCEVETQHIMNTMQLCRPKVGISMHSPGFAPEYKNMPDNAYFIYQGQGFDSARVHKVTEALYSNYGMGGAADVGYAQHYEMCGKSPAYIQYVGAVGGLTETVTQENGTNNTHTSIAMEQAYTQMLLFLQTWCEEALQKASE